MDGLCIESVQRNLDQLRIIVQTDRARRIDCWMPTLLPSIHSVPFSL